MTRDEAIDVITQSRLLIESLEILVRQAMAVLEIPDEALPKERVAPPKLTVVPEHTSDYGSPKDWKWDNTIYGDD